MTAPPVVKDITADDIRYIGELQPEGWSAIIPVFEWYVSHDFCHPVKVVTGNGIMGIGAGISYGNTAWLAHIIVKTEFRNKGLGSEIVGYLCNYLKENGVVSISLIATELGFPVYKKAGFVEQTEYIFYRRDNALENEISKNITRFSDRDVDDMLLLDRSISGENRSLLLHKNLSNAYIYRKKGRLSGYYLPGLGEGLIIADDAEAGIELMKLRYLKTNNGVLPVDNSEGMQFLKDNGFKEFRRAKRMICGQAFAWNPRGLYNRIAGKVG